MIMEIVSDFLVIGSGIAGLFYALKVADYGQVAIITKKEKAESNTNYAQGGIASVFSPDDSYELHIQDTLNAGAGLCKREAVELMVREGPRKVEELMKIGVEFTRTQNGRLDLGMEGGHSRRRIVHAKDLTGREIERALLEKVASHPNVKIFEHHVAIDLITEHHLVGIDKSKKIDNIHCWGVYALDSKTGEVKKFLSKVTLLATGGLGQVYLHTTNPLIATGDGVAMAYRAGAKIGNMEFIQFHPTTLYNSGSPVFLISEAVRGFGGILRTKQGEDFMKKYDPRGSLAPRDIVARAIDAELKKSGDEYVYLDLTHLNPDSVKDRFPHIYEKCLEFKIDITREPIPVVPAAHYSCGGVVTDLWGRTSIVGLYAAGEVAMTGVHGANRLASNSLLEALVFSERAAIDSVKFVRENFFKFPNIPDWIDTGIFNTEEWVLISHDKREIQQLMWDYVGIVRSTLRLERAKRRIELIADEIEEFYKKTKVTAEILELRNLAIVALLIIRSALMRKESRGLHFTTDYPERDDKNWLKDTIIQDIKI
ncbi:L-aspartate oxidase [Candidatus Thermokryptus mobilis]|nr:L-aspartate oxidase [Candidatus Thermokryptus mobilis]